MQFSLPIAGEPLLAISFASPWMLLAGLSALIPVAIHLWNYRQPTRHRWAASQFLQEAIEESSRRIRLERLALLAIRCGILGMLALALAEPLRSQGVLAGRTQHVVLILDLSMSMQVQSPTGSRLALAKQRLRETVDQAQPGTKFSLLTMGLNNEVVIWRQATPLAVRDTLTSLSAEEGTADAASMLEVLNQQFLVGNPGPDDLVRIVVASDFCANSWSSVAARTAEPSLGDEIELIDVGKDLVDNSAVVSVSLLDEYVVRGRPAKVSVAIRNFSATDLETQLSYSDDNGAHQSKVQVTAQATRNVHLNLMFREAKDHLLEFRIDSDSLAADNVYRTVVPVQRNVQVLCLESRPRAADYVATALNAADSAIDVDRASVLDPPPDLNYHAIVLCDATAMRELDYRRLNAFVEKGGVMLVSVGEATARIPEASRAARKLLKEIEDEMPMGQYEFDRSRLTHPVVQPFRANGGEPLSGIAHWKYRKLASDDLTDVVLYFSNGDPAVTYCERGLGCVIYFASSIALDTDQSGAPASWNALPLLPTFVPLIYRSLAFGHSVHGSHQHCMVGESITGPNNLPATESMLQLGQVGSESEFELISVQRGAHAWESQPVHRPGFYEARFTRQDKFHAAVNTDPRESNLSRIDFDAFPDWIVRAETSSEREPALANQVVTSDQGTNRLLLMAVVGLVLVEALVTGRRRKR